MAWFKERITAILQRLRRAKPSTASRYVGAALIIAACSLARAQMSPAALPYLFFIPGLMLIGFWFGAGPSLLGCIMAVLIAQYFFIGPLGFDADWTTWANSLSFGVVTFAMAVVCASLRRNLSAVERLNETLEQQVQHRTGERDSLWNVSPDLICTLSENGQVLSVNPAWQVETGFTEEQLKAGTFYSFISPAQLSNALRELNHKPIVELDTQSVRSDGQPLLLNWRIARFEGRYFAVARDVTQYRERQQAFEQVSQQLQQSQKMEALGQLTGGLAHDFNNLLTVILTSASFLQSDLEQGAPAERSLGRLQYIRESGERGATLTSQLLAFARRQQLTPAAIDLNDTLVSLLSLLKSTLGGSVSIETDTQANIWHALVDPTQIEMIILNLAINARDAMGDSGRLTLGTRNVVISEPALRAEDPSPGEYVVLSVTDTGTGMSEEVLSKAFEPFFTTKEVGKGSGLGLAQVFGFAKQSGGGACIESREGIGTTVKVFLPRTAAPQQVEPALALSSGTREDNSQHSILLVDDDHSVREVTALMLQDLGFAVTEAESGAHALQLLASDIEVDLLLADFAMPGMNGGELARAVRVRHPELPVIFVTGYAELCELGLAGYSVIQKPFREEQLASKIHLALREGSLTDG